MSSTELQVVFEDNALLVVDKPAGLLSVPGRGEDKQDCLSARVQRRFADALVVHRLDMATSGLMIWPNRPRRIIDTTLGKPSVTRWRVLVEGSPSQAASRIREPDTTRLELEPLTGRSHQLRVHLKSLGHAILGDTLYASPEGQAKSDRLLLHACGLTVKHPYTGQALEFRSAPPF